VFGDDDAAARVRSGRGDVLAITADPQHSVADDQGGHVVFMHVICRRFACGS
jgi:hypothetical protein